MRLSFRAFAIAIALLLAPAATTRGQAAVAARGRQAFNVVDYGAKNDGTALATDAFRAGIEAAKGAGGGTIYVIGGCCGLGDYGVSRDLH